MDEAWLRWGNYAAIVQTVALRDPDFGEGLKTLEMQEVHALVCAAAVALGSATEAWSAERWRRWLGLPGEHLLANTFNCVDGYAYGDGRALWDVFLRCGERARDRLFYDRILGVIREDRFGTGQLLAKSQEPIDDRFLRDVAFAVRILEENPRLLDGGLEASDLASVTDLLGELERRGVDMTELRSSHRLAAARHASHADFDQDLLDLRPATPPPFPGDDELWPVTSPAALRPLQLCLTSARTDEMIALDVIVNFGAVYAARSSNAVAILQRQMDVWHLGQIVGRGGTSVTREAGEDTIRRLASWGVRTEDPEEGVAYLPAPTRWIA
jgi:hypothetical protein